jgi:hypothetical protein
MMTDSNFEGRAGLRRWRSGRGARAGGGVVALLIAVSSGMARADVTYELVPSAGVGATDNAANRSSPPPAEADGFTSLSGTARLRVREPSAEHVGGYRLGWTHYLRDRGPQSLTNEVSWQSIFTLLGSLELRLGAAGTYGQTSSVSPVNVAAQMQGATSSDTRRFVSTTLTQGLTYQRTAQNRYVETVSAQVLRYLGSGGPISFVVNVDVRLGADWDFGRNRAGAEVYFSELHSPGRADSRPGGVAATARREFSLEWAGSARLGLALITPANAAVLIVPVGSAEIGYHNLFWYATLSVSQSPTTNLYLGSITMNDSASARLTLPLTKSERTVIGGYGGLTYGRVAGDGRAYDSRSAGGALAVRGDVWPLWLSLDYSISDQHGNADTGGAFPNLRRQVVMLNVGGTFMFGPGTPALFPGAL